MALLSAKQIFAGLLIAACMSFVSHATAQEVAPAEQNAPSATVAATPAAKVEPHKFWDRKNAWLFTGVAVSRTLDYTSTRNMLARGREELLIPDDVVNSQAGFPALEAAGAATSIGISYIFHRYGHHKMERWVSIVHIGVTCFGAAHNYALKSKH
jgi:hypothetical protein